jgi:putative oxidoreductase
MHGGPRTVVTSMTYEPDRTDPATNVALRLSVAVAFALTGADKFPADAASHWVRTFDAIGIGQWFRYATGIVEVAGGLLFLIPAATTLGAGLLVATMLGAMAVQAFVFGRPADSLFPAAYLAGVVLAYVKLRAMRRAGAARRADASGAGSPRR